MWECTDDVQGERIIRISKTGTLNIYIAVDISESIEKEHVENAKDAILKLITKVRDGCSALKNNAGTHSSTNAQNVPIQQPVTWFTTE